MAIDKTKKHLEDVITAITNIEASTVGLDAKHFSNYEISWIVERGIEIIAEALKRIISDDTKTQITNVQKIIATRNKITHEYDVVDNYQLYIIVTKYLPVLKKEVETLLRQSEKYN
jgi:uncharacterized protein with HEPN domain